VFATEGDRLVDRPKSIVYKRPLSSRFFDRLHIQHGGGHNFFRLLRSQTYPYPHFQNDGATIKCASPDLVCNSMLLGLKKVEEKEPGKG